MPQLHLDAPATGVHGVGDQAPAGGGGVVIQAAFAGEGTAVGRDHGGLGEDQAAARALRVVLGHQGIRDMAATGAGARQRRHDHAVGQFESTRLERAEKVGHGWTPVSAKARKHGYTCGDAR